MRRHYLVAIAVLAAVTIINAGIRLAPTAKRQAPEPVYGERIGYAKSCPLTIQGLDLSSFDAVVYASTDEAKLTLVCEPTLPSGPAQ